VLPTMIGNDVSRADRASAEGDVLSKVPQVTFAFWVVKILATTLGETGGDALSMSGKPGHAESTRIFLALFRCTLFAQVTRADAPPEDARHRAGRFGGRDDRTWLRARSAGGRGGQRARGRGPLLHRRPRHRAALGR